jgi:hypothetical protein
MKDWLGSVSGKTLKNDAGLWKETSVPRALKARHPDTRCFNQALGEPECWATLLEHRHGLYAHLPYLKSALGASS